MFAALVRNDSYLTTSKEQRIAIRKERRARLNRSPEVQLRQMYNEAPSMTDPPQIDPEPISNSAFNEAIKIIEDNYSEAVIWVPLIADIQEAVLRHYRGMTLDDLLSPRRVFYFVRARQIGMFLCYELTRHSKSEIARRFGRDHTTVIHAISKISAMIASDPAFAAHVDAIRESIGSFQ